MEFCLTRKEDVWEMHAHSNDDDGVMMMGVVVAAANTTHPILPESLTSAAARDTAPCHQLHEKVPPRIGSVLQMSQRRLGESKYLVPRHPARRDQR